MKNTWFETVFMPSLFERRQNGYVYLSQKQTDIVRNHAKPAVYTYDFTWQKRICKLSVYPNGKGALFIGSTPEEQAQWIAEDNKKHMDDDLERYHNIASKAKAGNERAEQRRQHSIKSICKSLESWISEVADNETPEDQKIFAQSKIDFLEKALSILQA